MPGRVTVARVRPEDANPTLKRQRSQSHVSLSTGPKPPTSKPRAQSLRVSGFATAAAGAAAGSRTTLRSGPHGHPKPPGG